MGACPRLWQRRPRVAAAFLMALVCAIAVFGIANFKGMGQEALVFDRNCAQLSVQRADFTMQFIANEEQLPAIVHWPFGSLNSVGWI